MVLENKPSVLSKVNKYNESLEEQEEQLITLDNDSSKLLGLPVGTKIAKDDFYELALIYFVSNELLILGLFHYHVKIDNLTSKVLNIDVKLYDETTLKFIELTINLKFQNM